MFYSRLVSYLVHSFLLLGFALSSVAFAADVGLLLDVKTLSGFASDEVTIIDARSEQEFAEGHIKHAYNIPFKRTYRKTLASGTNKVASSATIQQLFKAAGVSNNKSVIVYGGDRYVDAARVFWVLEAYGHQHVSMLNGGISAWKYQALAVTKETFLATPGDFVARPDPRRIASQFSVRRVLKNHSANIIDVRISDEYKGLSSKSRFAGHIPTAVNVPRVRHLSNDKPFMLKSKAELEEIYLPITDASKPYITYCQNGGEAAVAYFALRLLGRNVAVYDGSWSEWGNSLETPKVGKNDSSSSNIFLIEEPLSGLLEYSLAACQC
jgi:thiosulfate/3-mercaptopyruvate sulfurtransferase